MTLRVALLAAVALCAGLSGCGAPAAEVSAPIAPAASTAPVVRHPDCTGDTGTYAGIALCRPDGELATVSRALDAATLELTDGRRVRLLGVIAPAAGSCPASAATAAANSLTAGQKVILISQPGAGADPFGQAWVYAQLGDPMGNDLGQILAVGGWVAEYPESPASPEYQSTLTGRVDQAEATHVGAWGPPCGPALPDSTTTPASDSGRDIDVHVWHHDDHKSRFCRRHWYC